MSPFAIFMWAVVAAVMIITNVTFLFFYTHKEVRLHGLVSRYKYVKRDDREKWRCYSILICAPLYALYCVVEAIVFAALDGGVKIYSWIKYQGGK